MQIWRMEGNAMARLQPEELKKNPLFEYLTVDEIISQVKFILENMYITFDLSTIINIVNSGRLQVMSYCNKIDL